jgi:hypothetical protein
MASELIAHHALKLRIAKLGATKLQRVCASYGGCIRRNCHYVHGRASGTLVVFHQRCPIAAPSREARAIAIFCAAVAAGRRSPANRIKQLIESGGIA